MIENLKSQFAICQQQATLMANYECHAMIDLVSNLLFKGFVVKMHEKDGVECHETFFKRKRGVVYAKNRQCSLRPLVDEEGWEMYPLEYQDWWADIIVDHMLTCVSVFRYRNLEAHEIVIWDNVHGLSNDLYYIPPATIMQSKDTSNTTQPTLKELALLSLINTYGFHVLQELEYTLDKETIKTAKKSVEWWVE